MVGHRARATVRTPPAWCPSGARSVTTEGGLDVAGPAQPVAPAVRPPARRRHPGVAVHRAQPDPGRGRSRRRRRPGGRAAHRRLLRGGARGRRGRGRAPAGAAARGGRRRPPPLGLEVHAGHGIDYETVGPIAAIPEVVELNIGHFLIGEAIFVGLEPAIRRMRALMDEARAAQAHDHRPRLGPLRHPPHPGHPGPLRRPLHPARLHRDSSRPRPTARPTAAATYAKRFAAKEACAKALGTGVPRRGVLLARHGGGQPALGQADHGADRRRGRSPRRPDSARNEGAYPPQPDRRPPLRPGLRDHRGPAGRPKARDGPPLASGVASV